MRSVPLTPGSGSRKIGADPRNHAAIGAAVDLISFVSESNPIERRTSPWAAPLRRPSR